MHPLDGAEYLDNNRGNAMGHRGNAKGLLVIVKSALCMLAAAVGLAAFAAQAADPIKVGMVAPLTGPGAESGRFQTQGAKLAADEVNKAGGVLGRPPELVIEDDQTTNPGFLLAFSKHAGNREFG